jgi:hypothetical protein
MKQMGLYLRYYSTAERAFNRNLHDLRRLQKDRRQNAPAHEIGSVPQNAQPPQIVTPAIAKLNPVEPIFVASCPSAAAPGTVSPHPKAA